MWPGNMRVQSLVALLMISLAFAGCFGGGDEPEEHSCDDGHMDEDCPGNTTTTAPPGTNTTTTPPAPNMPPVAALDIFDAGGNATQVTLLGGSLTFDGSASEDPDGEVTEMAVILTDSNGTRSAQLIQNGQFTQATFTFDRPGVVSVIANVLDDRGDRASLTTEVYVNHPQSLGSFKFNGANPALHATDCEGPAGDIIDANYIKSFTFDVKAGATFVEATVEAGGDVGAARFAICDPDQVAISEEATAPESVTTNEGTEFTASLDYAVWVVSDAPQTDAKPTVIVHYEPVSAATPEA